PSYPLPPPPPSSTPFPSTTLFRSQPPQAEIPPDASRQRAAQAGDGAQMQAAEMQHDHRQREADQAPGAVGHHGGGRRTADARLRSEEHTSELQSHLNLVCRLLLEK